MDYYSKLGRKLVVQSATTNDGRAFDHSSLSGPIHDLIRESGTMVTDGQDIMISDSQDVTDLSNDRVH